MKILNIVKYYDPCQGGMESVVKNIVEGIVAISDATDFTVYSNNHLRNYRKETNQLNRITVTKEATPLYLKSQPLNLRYPSLKKLIKDHNVIHHHYPFPTMEFTLLRYLKKMDDKKFIITWHANIKNSRWSWIEKVYNPMIKKLLDRADSIVVTSPQLFEASDILKKYREKVTVIPLSFDPKYSLSDCKKYPENRCFKLLFVGKLRKYKGVEYLIKAIETLNVKLTVVGNGEEQANLEELVDRLKIRDKVCFIANANDEKLAQEYLSSDLFILPSINEAEAFGVVQLEAMANGLPVINTRLDSGVPFVSLHDYSGITVEPENSAALQLAIEKIINDKLLYEFFSANALERVKLFSREKMSEAYLRLYTN
ncbi:rhamnosyl/mannosyltransferase [Flavobacterium sp. CG_9.10]|uniref:glycosyltransferase n=1 Tax=Flavobacterium sp. CG_9.10 TaxID=2787729 RepID=UPI0018C9431A|nr:glycosyltransferase [Flavobacterium sp. CG_9.10]MBG6109856.1 rhamnosyl/mannosyltransferase [Flavobacterium sp. CG_9.10]